MGYVPSPLLGLHIFYDGAQPPDVIAFPQAPPAEILMLLALATARVEAQIAAASLPASDAATQEGSDAVAANSAADA